MVFKWYMTAALNSFVWVKSFKSLSFRASPCLLLWKYKLRGEKISSQHKFNTDVFIVGTKPTLNSFLYKTLLKYISWNV